MHPFKVGDKVWYTFENREKAFIIVEIRGNVATLKSENPNESKIKVDAYLNELKPRNACTLINVIGRASCE